jgi:hypothetical protein
MRQCRSAGRATHSTDLMVERAGPTERAQGRATGGARFSAWDDAAYPGVFGVGGGGVDPVTLGAVLLAVVTGASEALGGRLWAGVATLVRRPLRRKQARGAQVAAVPSGEAELAALEQFPGDRGKAVALAEALLARAGADADFERALAGWWGQAEPVRASIGNVTNTISGGNQQGPVLQGRDFSNLSFGASPSSRLEGPDAAQ